MARGVIPVQLKALINYCVRVKNEWRVLLYVWAAKPHRAFFGSVFGWVEFDVVVELLEISRLFQILDTLLVSRRDEGAFREPEPSARAVVNWQI